MTKPITMQRLIQNGWIPVLTGTYSAGVILSAEHSANIVCATALILLALYFAALAAKQARAKISAAISAECASHMPESKAESINSAIRPPPQFSDAYAYEAQKNDGACGVDYTACFGQVQCTDYGYHLH